MTIRFVSRLCLTGLVLLEEGEQREGFATPSLISETEDVLRDTRRQPSIRTGSRYTSAFLLVGVTRKADANSEQIFVDSKSLLKKEWITALSAFYASHARPDLPQQNGTHRWTQTGTDLSGRQRCRRKKDTQESPLRSDDMACQNWSGNSIPVP